MYLYRTVEKKLEIKSIAYSQ